MSKHRNRFHDDLEAEDTVEQTIGCRHSNPTICKNNQLSDKCAFVRKDKICLVPPISWKKQFYVLKEKQNDKN